MKRKVSKPKQRRKPASADEATFRPFAALKKPASGAPAKREEAAAPEPAPTPARATGGETFSSYMRGVDKLGAKARRVPATQAALEPPSAEGADLPDLDAPARERLVALVADAIRFEVVDDGTVIEGRRLDVDPRELRRLRQGRYPIDGTLDLHGQSSEDARAAVARFVARRRRQGDRAVLVVHGKGKHSPRGNPVLRGEIGAWLSQGAAAQHVRAFASVPEPDGRSGAVMVLLALLLALACGCSGEPDRPPSVPVPTARPTAEEPAPPMGVFRSKRFGLDLDLYDGKSWKIDDRSSHWLTATHPEGSSLLVRMWRDDNRMTRDKCEARARMGRKLPSREAAEIVEERAFDLPEGFDTRATVALVPSSQGDMFGFVLAFGGYGRRCFAFVYVTQAAGPRSGAIVADRLAKAVEGSLAKLVFRRDFEPPLERDTPLPDEPQR